jgi:hypothetical protein
MKEIPTPDWASGVPSLISQIAACPLSFCRRMSALLLPPHSVCFAPNDTHQM